MFDPLSVVQSLPRPERTIVVGANWRLDVKKRQVPNGSSEEGNKSKAVGKIKT